MATMHFLKLSLVEQMWLSGLLEIIGRSGVALAFARPG